MTSDLQALMFMSCNLLFLLYTSSSTLLSVKSSLSSLEVSLFEASFWRKYSSLVILRFLCILIFQPETEAVWLTSSVWAPGASTCRSAESGSRIYGSRPRPASCGADWDRLIPPRPPSRIWSSMVLRPGAPMDRKPASRNTAGPALQFLHKQQRERVASQDVFSCASD